MGRKVWWIGLLATFMSAGAFARDISGDWQGVLKVGGQESRLIVRIKKDHGGWKATVLPIDYSGDWGLEVPANSVTLAGSHLKITIAAGGAIYEGTVSTDGNSVAGIWTQGQSQPLDCRRATKKTAWQHPSPHAVRFVAVENNVRVEVLDWGGNGRPVVLLTGLGSTAHVFDKFALSLVGTYHVYGITRRGFGASSVPTSGYAADRLGDDVLAVLDALKISRPVLIGHSIAGEELSSVGSRHPETVAGLIYLDAGYSYAYYDSSRGDFVIDSRELQRQLEQLQPGKESADRKQLIAELLETSLPRFERELRELQQTDVPEQAPSAPFQAIVAGAQKYTTIRVPILAIFADPHDPGPSVGSDSAASTAFEARDKATMNAITKAFESGLPSARVVRLPHASHNIYVSNEADVLRETKTFIGTLP